MQRDLAMSVIKEMAGDNDDSELSDEAYEMRNRSMNSCSSDELEGNLDASEDEEESAMREMQKQQKKQWKQAPGRKYKQEVDTNVFKIDFGQLRDKAELATGDACFCAKCKAVFNVHSVVKTIDKEQQVWVCEFCNHENEVDIEEEEKPKSAAVNYIVQGAAQAMNDKDGGKKDISVVFCVDQSGSMCVSQPVHGRH